MTSPSLEDLDRRHIWRPFTQAATQSPALRAVSGKGTSITTADGKTYLDMVSSWWVNLHGHANPKIAQAISEQAQRLEQAIFAEFTHEPAIRLAAGLADILPGDLERVFYSDDGSTAVEVALKLALQYWRNQGSKRGAFIGFDGGYHGDTVGAMSLGRSSSYFSVWEEMLFPIRIAPFPATWDGDGEVEEKEAKALTALETFLADGKVAGVIIEPLAQGASGMRFCRPQFIKAVERIVHAHGTLLIFDEVMTGFGRTGDLFAATKSDVVPDMICLSKGLTGGFLPMAATVVRPFIYDAFLHQDLRKAFLHGHSYTANPLGCAAALASLELLLDPACAQARARIETTHRTRLDGIAPLVERTRSCGTIAAFTLADGMAQRLKRHMMDKGILIRPLGNDVYLIPPYCTQDAELCRVWDELKAGLEAIRNTD